MTRTKLAAVAAACVLAALGAGCRVVSNKMRGQLVCPSRGGPPWVELTSAHIVLHTDAAEDDARGILQELEETYSTLEDVGFPYSRRAEERVHAVLFSRGHDYDAVGMVGSSGHFSAAGLPGDPRPAVIFHGELQNSTRELLRHELTHRFVAFHYPHAPLWLNEGLAEYYAKLTFKDGHALFGKEEEPRFWKSGWREGTNFPVPIFAVPPVRDLLAMDRKTFYSKCTHGGEECPISESRRVSAAYAGAWALVHMLQNGEHRERFIAYIDALAALQPAAEAWNRAFAGISVESLQEALLAFMNRSDTRYMRTKYSPPAVQPRPPRRLADAEVHLLWAQLRRTPAEARTELQEALREQPGMEAAQAFLAALDRPPGPEPQPEAASPPAAPPAQPELGETRRSHLTALLRSRVPQASKKCGSVKPPPKLKFMVHPAGNVSDVELSSARPLEAAFRGCVESLVKGWRFPATAETAGYVVIEVTLPAGG